MLEPNTAIVHWCDAQDVAKLCREVRRRLDETQHSDATFTMLSFCQTPDGTGSC